MRGLDSANPCFNTLLTIILHISNNNMHVGEVIIGRGTIEDAVALTELSVTTFTDTFAADNRKEDMDKYLAEEMNLEKLSKELSDEKNLFFLVRYNGHLAGYAKLSAAKKPEAPATNNPVEIERIYVARKYQGRKIGAALMNECINYALAQSSDTVWLGVWEHNYKAVNFYNQWGFERYGSHEFRLGDDIQTDMLMKKDL